MNRRTLLKSLGLGLCAAMLGLWPDLSGWVSRGNAWDDVATVDDIERAWYRAVDTLSKMVDTQGARLFETHDGTIYAAPAT